MLSVRTQNEFLRTAECKIKKISKEHFVYERIGKQESILVIASRTHYETLLHIPADYQDAEILFCIGEQTDRKTLMPYGAVIFKKKRS